MDQRRIVLRGQLGHHVLPRLNPGAPCFIAVLPFADRQREGLAQHEPQLRICRPRLRDEFIISALKFIERHVMRLVIHADEDGQHVRLQLQRVFFPALLEFTHSVAR